MEEFYTNKNILITGGTGSLGQSITNILQNYDCNIVCLSRDEYKQWYIKDRKKLFDNVKFVLGDIRDKNIDKYFKNIDIVFHTAALKHIDYVENNSEYGIDINVNGTLNLLDLAKKNNVKNFITASTDKACSPSNVYGATKLLSERITIHNDSKEMKCSVIRFGNIFASRGSVVHTFHDLMHHNKKLLVYNENMTRFSVSMQQAGLNCLKVPLTSMGGDILIPKSESYNILDLAKAFIKIYKGISNNLEDYIDINSLRTSEKIHEDIISEYEFYKIYTTDDAYIATINDKKENLYDSNSIVDISKLNSNVNLLQEDKLCEIISEFRTNKLNRKFIW